MKVYLISVGSGREPSLSLPSLESVVGVAVVGKIEGELH